MAGAVRDGRGLLGQLIRYRWPDGFICPQCGHDRGYFIGGRHIYQVHGLCASGIGNGGYDFRGHQAAADEVVLGHIPDGFRQGWCSSALRLAQQIEVSWLTAHRMLRERSGRQWRHRDSLYRLGT